MIEMKYEGALSINANSETVEIKLTDGRSGVLALTLKMDAALFLAAIARNGDRQCKFWLNESGRVGSDSEVKTVNIPFDMYGGKEKHPIDTDPNGYRTPATAKALAPFEVDGWSAEARDMWNGHGRVSVIGKPHQAVRFFRFVRDEKPIMPEVES